MLTLLSRKGPLGAVLVAAYCHGRLKKAQILSTDIPFSVDKILDEGFSAFTYRILGHLLLGVVRIFSHKVEYVLLDSNRMLLDAEQAVASKRNKAPESSLFSPNRSISITLPESLELDKFAFEDIRVEQRRDHVLPVEEIMLKDVEAPNFCGNADLWACVVAQKFSSEELHREGVTISPETFSDSGAPSYKILSPMHVDPLVDMSLDDKLTFDMDIERSIETLIQKLVSLSAVEACDTEMVDLTGPDSTFHVMSSVNNDQTDSQNSKQQQPETSDDQGEKGRELSLTVEVSPERRSLDHSDKGEASQSKVVPTPTNIENIQIKGKRKCLFDEQVVLKNKTVKENIECASDIVRKRRRVPQTVLGMWKHELMSNMEENLTRPQIHRSFLDSKSCHFGEKLISAESPSNLGASKAFEIPLCSDDKNTDVDKGDVDVGLVSVADTVRWHIAIAPETPIRNIRHEGFSLGEGIVRAREGSPSNTINGELDIEEHGERPPEVYISFSSEADFAEPDGWSASPRKAIRDLSSAFDAEKGQHGIQQTSLQEAAKGKSKSKSAKLFYDILVLKSRGMVNVLQHQPYGDILVTKSSGWERWNKEICLVV